MMKCRALYSAATRDGASINNPLLQAFTSAFERHATLNEQLPRLTQEQRARSFHNLKESTMDYKGGKDKVQLVESSRHVRSRMNNAAA
jgi:hypothetical protein